MWFQLRVCCGVLALFAAGCQTYPPYGSGHGAPYGGYPQGMQPTYIQPTPQQGVPAYPQQGYPQPAGSSNLGSPQATPYGSTSDPSRSAEAAGGNLVPDSGYDDPTSGRREPDFGEEDFQEPFNPGASLEAEDEEGDEFAFAELGADAEFAEPVPLQPVSFNEPEKEALTEGARPNPFAHDATDYRWFRGVADYDPDEKSWYIVYNPDPSAEDRYSGTLTLKDHDDLIRLQRNDVILVQGSVDNNSLDRFGKPKFQIEKVDRLTPKPNATAKTGASPAGSVDTANFEFPASE